MLACLAALPLLLFAGLASAALGPAAREALKIDALLVKLREPELARCFRTVPMADDCRALADQAISESYSTQHEGMELLNYTQLLCELEQVVRDAGRDVDIAMANVALLDSDRFMGLRLVLEAEVGYCIEFSTEHLPKFVLNDDLLDTLNSRRRISMLPYIIDQQSDPRRWIHFIRGLVELKRFDLLDQLTFSGISALYFALLMSVPLPKSIVVTATKSLQKNEPTGHLSSLLAMAGFGDQRASWPEGLQVPVFLLPYLHANHVALLENHVLVDGLNESSIGFWSNLMLRDAPAREMINLVLKHGDDKTRRLAKVFDTAVSSEDLYSFECDVHQAMLIRFHFSRVHNVHIAANYRAMIDMGLEERYHTACALLDCSPTALTGHRYGLGSLVNIYLEALIDKACRHKSNTAGELLRDILTRYEDASGLLRLLVQRKADDSLIQLVWESIQNTQRSRTIDDNSCAAPLEVLERLHYDRNVSVAHVQEMLQSLGGFWRLSQHVPKEAHDLYTVMFWKAPERIISHYLDLLPIGYQLKHPQAWELLRQREYSYGLCSKLLSHIEHVDAQAWKQIGKLRPDLDKPVGR